MNRVLPLALLAIIFMSSFASAAGISTSHYGGKPLEMFAGQEKTIQINLQNMQGDSTVIFEAEVLEGGGIFELLSGTVYNLPPQTKDVPSELKISIPSSDQIGKEYTIKVIYRGAQKPSEGQVGFSVSYLALIPVKVVSQGDETPESTQPTVSEEEEGMAVWLWVLFAVLALIALIHYLIKKKNESLK